MAIAWPRRCVRCRGWGRGKPCARHTGPPFIERELGRQFSLLTEAQAAGDLLARKMVPHDCDLLCDLWMAVERREEDVPPTSSGRSGRYFLALGIDHFSLLAKTDSSRSTVRVMRP
jgi:hypothetical protein